MSKISITNVEEKGNHMSFKLKGVPVPYANAIRRVSMGQLPVYAIDQVTVYENNSAFFDEFIANRVGLIPIESPEKIDEEVMFSLNVEGPMLVTSSSLESSNSKVECANKNIPIVELGNKQVLRLEGTAKKGIGRQHAKFQAGIVSYGYDEEGEYNFVVESFGQMGARDIVKRSLGHLIERCKEFSKEV